MVEKVTCKIRAIFYWPGQRKAIKQWCKGCVACDAHKLQGPAPRASMTKSITGCHFERIAVELMGPLQRLDEDTNIIVTVLGGALSEKKECYIKPFILQENPLKKGSRQNHLRSESYFWFKIAHFNRFLLEHRFNLEPKTVLSGANFHGVLLQGQMVLHSSLFF